MTAAKNLALLVLTLWLGGCSTLGYYKQSTAGHLALWWQKKDIKTLIHDPTLKADTRERLELVLRIRQFASEKLALPDNASYTSYSDLGRDYVVWNVFAAPEFSVEPYRWCYWIVGCVSYRGYYEEQRAQALGQEMAAQGYDTYVAGISAYSTLGWFSDPVLNTFLKWRVSSLAGTVFHELAHQIVYIKDDTAFNEAFATAVQRLGVLYWFEYRQQQTEAATYLRLEDQQAQFSALLLATREGLQAVYAGDGDAEEKRRRKTAVLSQMRDKYRQLVDTWGGDDPFARWFDSPVNNARLGANLAYLEHVPAFYYLFDQARGDWPAFFAQVIALSKQGRTARSRLLSEYAAKDTDPRRFISAGYFSRPGQSASANGSIGGTQVE